MRAIVLGIIAAIAGFLAYIWLQPVCPGGQIVANEAACARAQGFSPQFCKTAFARAKDVASVSGPSYPTLTECNMHWPKCMERSAAGEAGPVPTSWRVARGAGDAVIRFQPQYDNHRQ